VIDSGVGGEADLPFVDPQSGDEITAKFGESAQIVQIAPDGSQTVAATLPSVVTGMDTIGGARLALLNGDLYATSGQLMGDPSSVPTANTAAVVKIEDGQVSEIANTWDLESSQNPDGFIYDSHPYGLAAGPDGYLWVTDAAANDLLKIDPASGEIEVVTVFEGITSPLPNPNRGDAMETDPVPTGITFDQEGTIYVSFLAGFPFVPGSAKVVQVSPDGQVSDYATGLTMLTDLRSAPDGNIYAVQFGEFTEQGPTPNSGKIIRVAAGDASEDVLTGLSFPTSIDFNSNGDAYVTTNGVGAPGSGEVAMFPGLAAVADSTQEAPATLPTSGGDESSSEQISTGLLLFGFMLVGSGFLLKGVPALSRRLNR
jgi:sugar lactone lactonase YvrE